MGDKTTPVGTSSGGFLGSRCPGRIQIVHLRQMVVGLRVCVETQLVVLTRIHPEEIRIVAKPTVGEGESEGVERYEKRKEK